MPVTPPKTFLHLSNAVAPRLNIISADVTGENLYRHAFYVDEEDELL